MHENRCQAETNLSMEPTFNMIKTELVEAYSNYKQLEGQYMKLKLEVGKSCIIDNKYILI
uniref:SJCHGC07022 protein n=1 Tax=Schistosoma japonicum TaxID=6182 RepID=Q3KTI1_SCHJA|nr:SJCHGC07022 protein [Schistosoma japonicum]